MHLKAYADHQPLISLCIDLCERMLLETKAQLCKAIDPTGPRVVSINQHGCHPILSAGNLQVSSILLCKWTLLIHFVFIFSLPVF